MTENKHVPGATYRGMSQMVSQRPKQALHQTKILVKTTTKNHLLLSLSKNYQVFHKTKNKTEQINNNQNKNLLISSKFNKKLLSI